MEAAVTIATIPAILAVVQLAKTLGLKGTYATVLAVALGVIVQVVEYAVYTVPTTGPGWYGAAATGLILGLSAAGLYDTAKIASTKPETVVIEQATPRHADN